MGEQKCAVCGQPAPFVVRGKGLRRDRWLCRQHAAEHDAKVKQQREAKMTFTFDDTDEELEKGIEQSMLAVAGQESGTGYLSNVSSITMSNAEKATIWLLKAIVDQNKVMMRQNELLRRALKGESTSQAEQSTVVEQQPQQQ